MYMLMLDICIYCGYITPDSWLMNTVWEQMKIFMLQ